MKPTGIAIIGSTGSIGCNTLRVVEALGSDRFRVVALGAGRNVAAADKMLPLPNCFVKGTALTSACSTFEEISTFLASLIVEPVVEFHASTARRFFGRWGPLFRAPLTALDAGKRVALATGDAGYGGD